MSHEAHPSHPTKAEQTADKAEAKAKSHPHSIMRLKLRLESTTTDDGGAHLKFSAIGNSDKPEDNDFSAATPSASLTMYVTNKSLHFKNGDEFYADFTPA